MDNETLFARWVERLRREEPRAVAILCQGSYARGAPEAHSDLDLTVLVRGGPTERYSSALDEQADGRLLHVTIRTTSLPEWLEQFDEPGESEEWAFFLPVQEQARLLWATPAAAARLEGTLTLTLGLAPQLQDLLESAAKVRNALARGDELGVRLAAQDLGLRCPALLALPDPPPPVTSRRAALRLALDLTNGSPVSRDDLLRCLGLGGDATTIEAVAAAALRVCAGVLAALEPHHAMLADWLEAGTPEALADGRLRRLLTQP